MISKGSLFYFVPIGVIVQHIRFKNIKKHSLNKESNYKGYEERKTKVRLEFYDVFLVSHKAGG